MRIMTRMVPSDMIKSLCPNRVQKKMIIRMGNGARRLHGPSMSAHGRPQFFCKLERDNCKELATRNRQLADA
jgi:hypothetical protein